jgi:hypothetical protein
MIEQRQVILPNDSELIAQLTSRRGWTDSKGRLVLEPKSDLRSRNLPSPDRADAVLGTLLSLAPGRERQKFEGEALHLRRPMDSILGPMDRRMLKGKGLLY